MNCQRHPAFAIFVVVLLTIGACSERKPEDTPAQRKALAFETAKIVLSGGTFEVITDAAVEQATQVFAARLHGEFRRELTKSEYDNAREAFREAFTRLFPAKDWEAPFAGLYEKHFTAAELDQLLKFYKTPAGLKFLQTQGILTSESAQIGVRLFSSKQEEFGRIFEQELKMRQSTR